MVSYNARFPVPWHCLSVLLPQVQVQAQSCRKMGCGRAISCDHGVSVKEQNEDHAGDCDGSV